MGVLSAPDSLPLLGLEYYRTEDPCDAEHSSEDFQVIVEKMLGYVIIPCCRCTLWACSQT